MTARLLRLMGISQWIAKELQITYCVIVAARSDL